LVFRRQDEHRSCVRFQMDLCTEIHQGWQLSGLERQALERDAFPRAVDLLVLSGAYNCTYDYYTSRLSGWSFLPAERKTLLSDEAWDRTIAIAIPAPHGARKQQDAKLFLQRQSQGLYDKIFVYVLGVIGDACVASDAEFPAATDSWRNLLAERLCSSGNAVRDLRASEIERLLAASCQMVTREAISLEYSRCMIDLLFVTFPSRLKAERFSRVLEIAIRARGASQVPACGSLQESLGGHDRDNLQDFASIAGAAPAEEYVGDVAGAQFLPIALEAAA